jgi:hypothetical protein
MMYYIEVPDLPTATNGLYKAIEPYLLDFHRLVIEPEKLETVKAGIIEGVQELNSIHKRCSPAEPKWLHTKREAVNIAEGRRGKENDDWTLYVSANHYNAYVKIKKAREISDL